MSGRDEAKLKDVTCLVAKLVRETEDWLTANVAEGTEGAAERGSIRSATRDNCRVRRLPGMEGDDAVADGVKGSDNVGKGAGDSAASHHAEVWPAQP